MTQAPAIWPQRYSNLLRFLSSGPGKTSAARIGFFCCCNSWRLSFMRRLRTYASGAFYKTSQFYIVLVSSGLSRGLLLEFFGDSPALPDAPGASIFCASCADPRPAPISYYCSHLGGLIFHAQAAGIRALCRSWAPRGLIFYAQAAERYVRR